MDVMKFGAAEIRRVEQMVHKLPIAGLTDDKDLIARNAAWLSPRFMDADGNWDLVFQTWLLQVDDRIVVVDPCAGNGRSGGGYPMFHMLDIPFLERMSATGIWAEDVDFVFCTHLHSDHCGWNTQLRGGRFVPTFPNARYVIVQREFDRWDPRRPDHREAAANATAFSESVLPVVDAGLAELVSDRHRISPSLAIEPAYGHTAGHSILNLSSQGEVAYFTGDVFHHPLEIVYPDLDLGAHEDFATAVATRRRVIAQAIEHNALLVPAHFAAPHAGRLRVSNGATVFEPLSLLA